MEATGSSDTSVTFPSLYYVISHDTVIFIPKGVSLVFLTFTVSLLPRKIVQNCRGPTRPCGPSLHVAMTQRWKRERVPLRLMISCCSSKILLPNILTVNRNSFVTSQKEFRSTSILYNKQQSGTSCITKGDKRA